MTQRRMAAASRELGNIPQMRAPEIHNTPEQRLIPTTNNLWLIFNSLRADKPDEALPSGKKKNK